MQVSGQVAGAAAGVGHRQSPVVLYQFGEGGEHRASNGLSVGSVRNSLAYSAATVSYAARVTSR